MEQRDLEQLKATLMKFAKRKYNALLKRMSEVIKFLENNQLEGLTGRCYEMHCSPVVETYGGTFKVVGLFGDRWRKWREELDEILRELPDTTYTIIVLTYENRYYTVAVESFRGKGRTACNTSDSFDFFASFNSPRLILEIGKMLERGVEYAEKVYKEALKIIATQVEKDDDALREIIADSIVGGD